MFSNLRYVLLSLVCFLLLLAAATFVLGSSAKNAQYLITYVVTTLTLTALAFLQKFLCGAIVVDAFRASGLALPHVAVSGYAIQMLGALLGTGHFLSILAPI